MNKITHWEYTFLQSSPFMSFLELIPEAVIFSDEEGKVVLTNQVARELFQYSEKEFLQLMIEDLVPPEAKAMHPKLRADFFRHPESRLMGGRGLNLHAVKKNAGIFPMESALFSIMTDQGPVAVNLIRDISHQKKRQKEIYEYAFVDDLTNLPNRRYLEVNMQRDLARAVRYQEILAVLYFDLDGFKPINDTYGHEAGDHVLCELSRRVSKVIRKEDFFARLGGDEFIITVFPVLEFSYLEILAERILKICKAPYTFEGKKLYTTVSIGINFTKSKHVNEQQLLKLADQAMYQAKANGGDCFSYAKNI